MKYRKILPALLSALYIGAFTACGGSSAMSENDIALVESIAESVAEAKAAEVAESVAESVAAANAGGTAQAKTDSSTSPTEAAETGNATQSTEAANAGNAAQSTGAANAGNAAQSGQSANAGNAAQSAEAANTGSTAQSATNGFAKEHGALRLDGTKLVDQNGNPIQLYGMSTHGIAWFPDYVGYNTFQTLRDDWKTNCVRIAMYTHEYGGYCSGGDQKSLKSLVKTGVDAATDLGMYVIIDWHVLQEQDPNVYKTQAIDFFKEMSETYADHTNVLYEICNEPNGYATWDSVKSYAEEVIPVIRANDPDAIVIVGTPTWSQDIDKAKEKPLDFDNVMYAMHFYAGTHKDVLWNRLDSCVQNGLPVFISEFGMCDASGSGGNDFNSTKSWFDVIERYNLSFCCWNLANKNETSSVISPSCSKLSDWSEDELSESGKWIRNYFRNK